jgi:hypothetical protein
VDEPDGKTKEVQVALALAALSVAFARVLQEVAPDAEPLLLLQRKLQIEQIRLRQTPNAETAVTMFRFVIDTLRNPDVIEHPYD